MLHVIQGCIRTAIMNLKLESCFAHNVANFYPRELSNVVFRQVFPQKFTLLSKFWLSFERLKI